VGKRLTPEVVALRLALVALKKYAQQYAFNANCVASGIADDPGMIRDAEKYKKAVEAMDTIERMLETGQYTLEL
jgi:hypothetical protein